MHRPFLTRKRVTGLCLALVLGGVVPLGMSAEPLAITNHADLHEPLPRSEQMTLLSVFEQAINQAPESLLQQSSAQQAQAMQALARRWIVGAPAWQTSMIDDRLQTDQGVRELETGIAFDLWRPGERRNALAMGDAWEQRSAAWQQWLQWLIAGRLRSALADMEQADLALRTSDQVAADALRLLETTRRMQAAGAASELDVMQAESLWLQRSREQMDADAARVDAEREWQVLTGLSLRPAAPHRESLSPLETIPADHPLLALRQSELAVSDAAVLQAEREARGSPSVSVGLRRERGDWQQPYINSAAVTVSIPFSTRAVVDAAGSEARAARSAADVARLQDLRELTARLHEVKHELSTVADALPLAEREHTISQRQQQMAETAFETGELELPQVILILQRARESALAHQQLLLRQQHLEAEYNQIVGVLP